MNSKRKGSRGERMLASILTEAGFPARRGQQFKGGENSPDVICPTLARWHWESKFAEQLRFRDWLAQVEGDCGGKPWVIAWKRRFGPWLAVMKLDDLLDIIREAVPSMNRLLDDPSPSLSVGDGMGPRDPNLSAGSIQHEQTVPIDVHPVMPRLHVRRTESHRAKGRTGSNHSANKENPQGFHGAGVTGPSQNHKSLLQTNLPQSSASCDADFTAAAPTQNEPNRKGPDMKLTDAFPSKWLKAADLDGGPRLVTIESVKLETVEEGKPAKPVVTLRGMTQGLVLNKTNGNSIAAFLGDDTDTWTGKKIVLYPTQAEFQGRMTDCIRVRAPKPQAAAPAPAQAAVVPAPARPSKAAEELPVESDDVPF